VWVIIGSISILPSMYQSTIFGTSVRPRAPPKAVPRQVRPVTSWNGRVEISAPAGATPMMIDSAPALVRAFQRRAHHLHVAGGVEGIIRAALGQVHQIGHQIALDLGRVDEIGHPELLGHGASCRVQVDADDLVGADQPQPLDDVEPDAAQPEDDGAAARFGPWRC
jgi:hypothetical protein